MNKDAVAAIGVIPSRVDGSHVACLQGNVMDVVVLDEMVVAPEENRAVRVIVNEIMCGEQTHAFQRDGGGVTFRRSRFFGEPGQYRSVADSGKAPQDLPSDQGGTRLTPKREACVTGTWNAADLGYVPGSSRIVCLSPPTVLRRSPGAWRAWRGAHLLPRVASTPFVPTSNSKGRSEALGLAPFAQHSSRTEKQIENLMFTAENLSQVAPTPPSHL